MDMAELQRLKDRLDAEREPGEEFTIGDPYFDLTLGEVCEKLDAFQTDNDLHVFQWNQVFVDYVIADDPCDSMRPALVCDSFFPGLAIVEHSEDVYNLTHRESGCAIIRGQMSLIEALNLAVKIGRWTDWNQSKWDIAPSLRPEQRKMLSEYSRLKAAYMECLDS